ncbi:hypothetical protein J7I98_01365 [Streptomyces sp. ISL-98]|uniref:hypothetical protein n=1 Tax=Streptomyces sp. ISL-98 TaxID=2819192 RepID=UPI001BEB1610|nr:hypothetical protein [Streptomyces sp. ISL-98]MBT2504561.1 hypothetical protein [Streptomyces sp. ISL-98]
MSSTEALTRLSTELGGAQPPPSIGRLEDGQLALLADALRRERERRASGLGVAAEEALKLVPALARGPVRRILFK